MKDAINVTITTAAYLARRAVLLLACLPPIHAQTPPAYQQWPDCATAFTLTSLNQNSAQIDNTQVGCTVWAVQYSTTTTGPAPSVSLTFQSAVDNGGLAGTWGAYTGTMLTGANPLVTVGAAQSTFAGYVPWVRVRVTGINNVSVRGNLYGWKTRPQQASAPVATDVNVLNFPANQAVTLTSPAVFPVTLGDTPTIDAFSRIRVSTSTALFESQQEYLLDPVSWNFVTATGGTSTYNTTRSSTSLSVTAASGSQSLIQTREYIRYQPGKSQLIMLTGLFGVTSTNNAHRVGLFDDSNGLYLEVANGDTAVSFVRRTDTSGAVVNNPVSQASWNLDTMDGGGPSGITLDFTKVQVLVIDYQWLGAGRVRMGFNVGGVIYYAHQFLASNVLSVVYMRTPNLPVRYENINTGVAAVGSSLEAIASSVSNESGHELHTDKHVMRSASTGNASISVGTAFRPVLCIRPALVLNGKSNRAVIEIDEISVMSSDNALYALVYYGTPTGGTFQPVSAANAVMETDGSSIGGTVPSTAITGGVRVYQGYVNSLGGSSRSSIHATPSTRMPITISYDGATPDYVCLCAQSFTGTVAFSGAISWKEVY